MRDTVFIHTNRKQRLGALVSAYSMKARSQPPDAFDVRIMGYEGRAVLVDPDVVEEEIESQHVRRDALALVNAHLGNAG